MVGTSGGRLDQADDEGDLRPISQICSVWKLFFANHRRLAGQCPLRRSHAAKAGSGGTHSNRDLEPLLRGFNTDYSARRQGVLYGKTPNPVVAERLEAQTQLSKPKATPKEQANHV